ncbi:MAG: DUF1007 family protein [Spirochaetia bacterium]|jgi:ABC-type uncharacterized transport system substrate-binding protein
MIERFAPSVPDKNKLVYTFFIPLKLALQQRDQTVRLTVYDDSYYIAFDLLHIDDVTVQAGPDIACDLSIEKTKVKPLWLMIRFKGSS